MNFCLLKNVNVARFARNVKCDFFCDFQTLWSMVKSWLYFKEQEHEQQFKGKSQKFSVLDMLMVWLWFWFLKHH